MIRTNFCVADISSTVTPAPPFGGLHRKAGAQYTVWLRNEGLGPGLRRGDGVSFEYANKNTNPSIHLPSQAKMPQAAIQMRGFNS
jgi:hypothetical protein